jgi:hypothetical protein
MSRLTGIPIGGHPQGPCAPIFGVADYGIADDFKDVFPILKEKSKGMR